MITNQIDKMKIIYYNNFETILKETEWKNRIIVSHLPIIRSRENIMLEPSGDLPRLSWTNPSIVIIEESPAYEIFMECLARSRRIGCIVYINPLKMEFEVFNIINNLQND